MKVLFIGCWKDGTGWGNVAQDYIMALDAAGIDVVPRAINLSNTNVHADIPERILELEQNDESGCDVCIQHVLPNYMVYDSRFDLNIGILEYETTNFSYTDWTEYLNMMDQIWVPNTDMVNTCTESGVCKPIFVVPHCCDISKYTKYYKPYPIPETQDKFVFYTIGEMIRRKNIAALIKAFHLEFDVEEPVCLMIKTNVHGATAEQSGKIASQIINDVKAGLRIYPNLSDYHNELVITEWLDTEKIMRLHTTGDCFVSASYGEAWCIPGFDAMALGKPVILPNVGGPKDYIQHNHNGLLISGRYEPAFMRDADAPIHNIWTAQESWYSVDVYELMRTMRTIYEEEDTRNSLGNAGIDSAYQYSYKQIGKRIKELIDETKINIHGGTSSLR